MNITANVSRRGFVLGLAGMAAMGAFLKTPMFGYADDAIKTETPFDTSEAADLIIVGGGGAGLSAAVAAVDAGATHVIVLESQGRTGGSLNLTSGSMSCAESTIQAEDGIEDSVESYVEDILRTGSAYGGKPSEELVRLYAEEDIPMFQWLLDHGMLDEGHRWSTDAEGRRAVFAPEHELYSIPRTYKVTAADSATYASVAFEILDTYVAGVDAIEIVLNTTAVELAANDQGQVTSVVATAADGSSTLYTGTHGVVMCTGGYGANRKLMAKYDEKGGDYLIGCGSWSTGRGLQMMQKMGAVLINMDSIPTFPMGLEAKDAPGHGSIASTYTWKAGGICVNANGERFMNENDESPTEREEALVAQPHAIQYDIFTDKVLDDLRAVNGAFFYDAFYGPEDSMGHWLVHTAPTLEELAEDIGIPAAALVETVEQYNASVDGGGTDEFGRTYDDSTNDYKVCNNKIEGDLFYAIPIKALCVMTLGGVKTDTDMNVLDAADTKIAGLYAGGEVVGGIWGKFVSGGTGVMGALTFGHIAGNNAYDLPLGSGVITPAAEILDDELFVAEKIEGASFDLSQELTDGVYSATVDGQEGFMTLEVTIEGGQLTGCEVIEEHETAAIGGAALETLIEQVLAAGGTEIDGVTGATLTTNRVRGAVAECLEEAANA